MIDDHFKLNQITLNNSNEDVEFNHNHNNLRGRRIIRHSLDEYSDNEDENIEENDENVDYEDYNDENNNFESNRNRSAEPKEQFRTMSRMKASSIKQKIRSYPLSDKNQLYCDYLLNIATAYNSSSLNYLRTKASSSNTLKYYHDHIPIIMEQRIIIESEQLELNLRLHPNFALICMSDFHCFFILI